jgi:DNA-binding transcriptional MerR regulator
MPATRLSIGQFSQMSYLSVRTLRRYHASGLLEPAQVDPTTGYRYYRADQLPAAQLIRRLRSVEMPLDEVRDVLAAPDAAARDALISAHLRRMERSLEQTRNAVHSLRQLLERPRDHVEVRFETAPPLRALAISGDQALDEIAEWFHEAFAELHAALADGKQTGPDSALYFPDFFRAETGRLTVFVPTEAPAPGTGRAQALCLPTSELALTLHDGPLEDLDRTYAALGTYVTDHGIGVDGPILERFLTTSPDAAGHFRVEVGWPIVRTASGTDPVNRRHP